MAKLLFNRPTIILTRSHFDSELIARRFNGLFFYKKAFPKNVFQGQVMSMCLGDKKPLVVCKAEFFDSLVDMFNRCCIDCNGYDVIYDKTYTDSIESKAKTRLFLCLSYFKNVSFVTNMDNLYYKLEIVSAFDVKPNDVFSTEEKRNKELAVQEVYKTRFKPKMQFYIGLRKSTAYYKGIPNQTCYRVI